MNEFDLVRRYFDRPHSDSDIPLGIGDDAAIIAPSPKHHLVVSTDMLVEGRHFFSKTDPHALGYKTLAVNLSDMAAMGAWPRWVLLSLALPEADPIWLDKFSEGFFTLADHYRVTLVGGDTTRGPLTLSVTMIGEVPLDQALRRDKAAVDDDIWVSGELGLAAFALQYQAGTLKEHIPQTILSTCQKKLALPTARVELGIQLRAIASAAIDISDGLYADLGHLMQRSGVAAIVNVEAVPTHPWLKAQGLITLETLVAGGDDYELCFTAPPQQRAALAALAKQMSIPLTRIGYVAAGEGVQWRAEKNEIFIGKKGFDHFTC